MKNKDKSILSLKIIPKNEGGDFTEEYLNLKSYYENKLYNACASIFDYKIISDLYVPRNLFDKILIYNSKILAYKDEELGVIFPRFANKGLDFYGEPVTYDLWAWSGDYIKRDVPNEKLVIGYNTQARESFRDQIDIYSGELATLQIIRRQNLKLSRGFIYARVEDNKKELALNQVLNDWLGFKQFVTTTNNFNKDTSIEIKDVNFKGLEYNQFRKNLIGEFFESIGIKSIDIEKGSHILNAEASRSEASTNKLIDMYNSRLLFFKDLKEKFDIDIKVELNANKAFEALKELLNDNLENDDKEIEEGENERNNN